MTFYSNARFLYRTIWHFHMDDGQNQTLSISSSNILLSQSFTFLSQEILIPSTKNLQAILDPSLSLIYLINQQIRSAISAKHIFIYIFFSLLIHLWPCLSFPWMIYLNIFLTCVFVFPPGYLECVLYIEIREIFLKLKFHHCPDYNSSVTLFLLKHKIRILNLDSMLGEPFK